MKAKQFIKTKLHESGIFPVARLAYRQLNPTIRTQRRREIEFYRNLVKPGSLVFDIGANLGQKSDVFLAAGFRSIIVEPNKHCEPSLRLQFEKSPDAVLDMRGVGAAPGTFYLYAVGTESTASMRPDWHEHVYGEAGLAKRQPVEITTLDALISQYGVPAFIKIDVEGYEIAALSGLSHKVPLISFEFHQSERAAMIECLCLLRSIGDISIRASNGEGLWLGERTSDIESWLAISTDIPKGDLFVWTE